MLPGITRRSFMLDRSAAGSQSRSLTKRFLARDRTYPRALSQPHGRRSRFRFQAGLIEIG
jgi:hypothetical protein